MSAIVTCPKGNKYDLTISSDRHTYWSEKAKAKMLNKKIVDVGYELRDPDCPNEGFTMFFTVQDTKTRELTKFWVEKDDEGNGAGSIQWANKNEHGVLPTLR